MHSRFGGIGKNISSEFFMVSYRGTQAVTIDTASDLISNIQKMILEYVSGSTLKKLLCTAKKRAKFVVVNQIAEKMDSSYCMANSFFIPLIISRVNAKISPSNIEARHSMEREMKIFWFSAATPIEKVGRIP